MDKKQFKEFCKTEFQARGFQKRGNLFYLTGRNLLCGMDLQKSDYSEVYYVNYYYFIGAFENITDYPAPWESDVQGRIVVMSRKQTHQGKQFMTAQIEYEEYTEEELRPYFDRAFREAILPPVNQGKSFILDNLGKIYVLTLHQEEVMEKLQS